MKQGKGPAKRTHWSQQTPSTENTRDDLTYGHHQMISTKIRLIIFFATKDGEALYSQQKHCGSDHEFLIAKFRIELRKQGKPLDNSGMI